MTRPTKPAGNPNRSLIRARAARERIALQTELREERRRAAHAKGLADKRAALERAENLRRIEDRILAGGYGNRPATPAEDTVRTTINDAYADKLGW